VSKHLSKVQVQLMLDNLNTPRNRTHIFEEKAKIASQDNLNMGNNVNHKQLVQDEDPEAEY
jgi:hypothetical protein